MTHILVTRPLEASQQLAGQLESLGLLPIVMPLYTFAGRNPSFDMNSAWAEMTARKLAVFTSPRAVQFGLSHIPRHLVGELELAVVGSATRAILESSAMQFIYRPKPGLPVKTCYKCRNWLLIRVLP